MDVMRNNLRKNGRNNEKHATRNTLDDDLTVIVPPCSVSFVAPIVLTITALTTKRPTKLKNKWITHHHHHYLVRYLVPQGIGFVRKKIYVKFTSLSRTSLEKFTEHSVLLFSPQLAKCNEKHQSIESPNGTKFTHQVTGSGRVKKQQAISLKSPKYCAGMKISC